MATVFDVYGPKSRKPVRIDFGEAPARWVTEKAYVGLSVYQGVVDEVKVFFSQTSADRFVRTFEREQGIKGARERKHQREYKDTYATWYECEME